MRLATIRTGGTTTAIRLDGDEAVELDAPDVGAVLHWESWRDRAAALPEGDASRWPASTTPRW